MWVADQQSSSIARFDPQSGAMEAQIALDEMPVALGATPEFLAAGLATGSVIAFDPDSGRQLWRRSVSGGDMQLKTTRYRLWIWDREVP